MIKQVHFASLLLNLLPYYRDFMKSTVKFAEMKKKFAFFHHFTGQIQELHQKPVFPGRQIGFVILTRSCRYLFRNLFKPFPS